MVSDIPQGEPAGAAMDLRDRLDLLGLDAADRARLRELRPLIEAATGPALEAFCARIRERPELAAMFRDVAAMAGAVRKQTTHWARIAEADFGPDYAAAVRRVGRIHADIGLEPKAYMGGYGVVLDTLIRQVVAARLGGRFGLGRTRAAVLGAELSVLVRAALLDIELSVSLYLENIEAARQRAEAAQAEASAQLAGALGRLAEGDLGVRIDSAIGEETRFNSTVVALATVMGTVGAAASRIDGNAREIAAAAEDLSRRTEQQAASLEQTAAALDQLTGNVRAAAQRAETARRRVSEVRQDAETSGRLMSETRAAIDRVEGSSREVGQIISLIDEIAFQTNLLALNAGVESARAGEAGRGFAVVASEVRVLAQRSSDAARQIRALIDRSNENVSEGVSRVEATAEALHRIVGGVAEVDAAVAEMVGSAQAQSTGIAEINAAVAELDKVTQQNAAMVEENTATANSLRSDAEGLSAEVGRFSSGGGAAPGPLRRYAAE